MTGKKKLVLLPSRSMDNNRKEGRNENGLIRMPSKAREFMNFEEDKVEIWTVAGAEKKTSVLLDIFHAYAADVKKVKDLVRKGDFKPADLNRIGFVTTKMYNRITGGQEEKNIWVSTGVHDTVVGADPEFLLFNDKGEVVHANGVMKKEGMIGCDGAMAEVRPSPSTDPKGLIENIRSAFSNKSLTGPISPYEWRAGCYFKNSKRDYPMGGHIHFGNPAKVAQMQLSRREMFFNVLNKIVDEFVSIPCMRLDGEAGSLRRTKCQMSNTGGWGYFGEWRTCNGRLEHRTLSGMWLMHPSVAMCVIGTAKAVSDEVFKKWAQHKFDYDYVVPMKYKGLSVSDMNNDSFTNWKYFPVCNDLGSSMESKELRATLNASKAADITKSWLNTWHSKMKKMSTYGKYAKYIDGLREILSINLTELSKWDYKIQANWLENKKFLIDV
jgi:hypothetical protein